MITNSDESTILVNLGKYSIGLHQFVPNDSIRWRTSVQRYCTRDDDWNS